MAADLAAEDARRRRNATYEWRGLSLDERLRHAHQYRLLVGDVSSHFGDVYEPRWAMRYEYNFQAQRQVEVEGSGHFREFDDVGEDTYFDHELTTRDYEEIWKLTRWRPPPSRRYYRVQKKQANEATQA